jgi:hypothetical protein
VTMIVVPWRDTPNGDRAAGCRAVCAALRQALPGFPVLLADSGHEVFNRAASRNCGVSAVPTGHVAVVCDADILPDPQALAIAVAAAYDGRLHYPFTTCHYLTEAGTHEVLNGQAPDPARIEFTIPGAQGGIMVMLVEAWLAAGGMDERFIGWGYEDNAWHATITAAVGPPVRHDGLVWHLWHPSDRNTVTLDEARNLARCRGQS